MKRLIFILLISFVFTDLANGGDGPFGLEMGMTLGEAAEVLGETPSPNAVLWKKTLRYGYSVSAENTPAEFESFILTITPKAGLCEIYLRTGEFPINRTDVQGLAPRALYQRLADQVTSQYGAPVKEAIVPPPGEDLFGGETLELSTVWIPGKHGLDKIVLGWIPASSGLAGSQMSILYVFNNRGEAMKEYLPKERPEGIPGEKVIPIP